MTLYSQAVSLQADTMGNIVVRRVGQGLAVRVRQGAVRIDPRLRVLLCAAAGLAAWTSPWRLFLVFLLLALILAWTAWMLLPGGRKALLAYSIFSLFWAMSWFFLQWWEHSPLAAADLGPLLAGALLFGARLFALLGLALVVPLSTTALTLGRVLTWYVRGLARLESALLQIPPLRGRVRPRLVEKAWCCGLALCIMISFLPRALRTLTGLRRSLALRAPRLPLRRRMSLLGLGALRLLGTQTWDMTLSIASRDLYRELPWNWR